MAVPVLTTMVEGGMAAMVGPAAMVEAGMVARLTVREARAVVVEMGPEETRVPVLTMVARRTAAPRLLTVEDQPQMLRAAHKARLPRAVVVRPMEHLLPIAAPGLGLTQRAGIKVLVPMGILVHLMVAASLPRRTQPAATNLPARPTINPPARPTIKSRLLPLPVLPEELKAPALLEIWGRRWTQPQRQQQQRQHLPWEAWLVLEANLLDWARWRPPAPLPPLRL
jgi:hypothetical protein